MDKLQLLQVFSRLTARATRLRTELGDVESQLRTVRKQLEGALIEGGGQGEEVEQPAGQPAPEHEPQESIRDAVELVRTFARPVGIDEVKSKLGISYAAARLRLNRAARLGLLRRAGRGKYEIAGEQQSTSEEDHNRQ